MIELTSTVCELARNDDAPIVFYPFGPKVLCLAAVSAAVGCYSLRTWFVYPVPARYSVDHASGAREVFCFDGYFRYLGSRPALVNRGPGST